MGEASVLLGVAPATLRRWVAEGKVPALTTPGGHHRLARSSVEELLPHRAATPFAADDPQTADRIHRAYREAARDTGDRPAFLDEVPTEAREPLRAHGRVITASILRYLEASDRDRREAALAEGLLAAAAYGRIAGMLGASMRETVATFLRFRMPLVHEMAGAARRQGLDAAGATEVLEAATVAIDRLLDATLEGYEHAAARPSEQGGGPGAAR
jgi:excisionase family DNA binding protein